MNTNEGYIIFNKSVNSETCQSLIDHCNTLMNQKVGRLYILFNSTGGQLNDAFTIYNYLRAIPIEIITHNIGSVSSMANIPFLAGKIRKATQNSSFFFHGVHVTIPSPKDIYKPELLEYISDIENAELRMKQVMLSCTKLSESEVDDLLGSPKHYNAQFALEKGIIDEITDASIQMVSNIVQI